ncbi:hypothetical protein TNCV_4643901 [Trichonephila clavipes]|nr:hypothetical protein TNCV_4643901 [Trichonephila clavipes]
MEFQWNGIISLRGHGQIFGIKKGSMGAVVRALTKESQRADSTLSPKPKIKQLFLPDEEPKSRLTDPIVRPITVMPLRRMQYTTFVMPNIPDYPDMGLMNIFTVRMPEVQRLLDERESILQKD